VGLIPLSGIESKLALTRAIMSYEPNYMVMFVTARVQRTLSHVFLLEAD
jgi:hypothetical protein